MGSNVDQKKLFNKLKHDLESWREVVLITNSILKWEKKFFPAVIFVMTTFVYLIMWYLDLSALTLISLGLFLFTIVDYAFPLVSKIIFKPENWTGAQENKFEQICNEICSCKLKLCGYCNYLLVPKEDRSTMFVISVSGFLLALAWIGSVIDNMLLSYFATLLLCFYPGLHEHGIIGTIKSKIGAKFNKSE